MQPGAAWMQQVLAVEVQKRQMEEQRNKAAAAVAAEEDRIKSLAAAKVPVDKSKPVSSTPISGTPWCVVWTGDGRVFFYNPSTKTSVWERPEELAERADVTKAMSTVPEALLASNPSNVVQTNRAPPQQQVLQQPPPNLIGGTAGNMVFAREPPSGAAVAAAVAEGEASDSNSDEEGDGFPSKKFKGDGEFGTASKKNTLIY